ncbi:MAG: DEAD/DEAH box helicase [Balneolaceae bacterium]|nr:DEAD/DEAH box helicase [Balneolaceae bacterium]
MHYYYREYDPVLLKLSNSTVSALYDQDIICIEDLFGFHEDQILGLYGIGKKRADEIIELLNSLPFDYMDRSLPPNQEGNPFLGIDPKLTEHLRNLYRYANDQVFKRGLDYYCQNRVASITENEKSKETWQATVRGARHYKVEISLKGNQGDQTRCNCPAFKNWMYGSDYCKHIIATLFSISEKQRLSRYLPENEKAGNQNYRQMVQALKTAQKESELINNGEISYLLEHTTGQWNLYPKSIYALIKSQKKVSRHSYSYNYKNPWDQIRPNTAKDRIIISHLREIYDTDPYDYGYGHRRNVSENDFGDIIELLAGQQLKLKHDTESSSTVYIDPEPFSFCLEIKTDREEKSDSDDEKSQHLDLRFLLKKGSHKVPLNGVDFVSPDPFWVYHKGNLSRVETSEMGRRFMVNAAHQPVKIPAEQSGDFLNDVLPVLQEAEVGFDFDDDIIKEQEVKPEPKLYLSESNRKLFIELRLAYGDLEVKGSSKPNRLYVPAQQSFQDNGEPALIWSVKRDREAEHQWFETVLDSDLKESERDFIFTPENDPLEWVVDHLPQLAKAGFQIFGEGDLNKFSRPKKMTSSSFRVSSKEQWFELEGEMMFGDVAISINDIKKILIKDRPYIQLQDNSTGELPANWLKQLKKLLHLTDSGAEKIKVPKIAANILEELGQTADVYEKDTDFDNYTKRLRSFEKIDAVEPPKKLKGELRSYQLASLSWMNFLNRYGFGGILADDMGLGKTIQVLALLQKIAESEKKKPQCLILAPRSVIHNWQAESEKFTPEFKVYIHHGTDRIGDISDWPDADLCITTYSTMRNDIEVIENISFDYAILDESHTVRNPASKTFMALKRIKAKNRLCMSGTPVQNTSMDLWSQFQFLNPGLLGSQKRFREQWVKPIEANNDNTAQEMLHSMVSPFILRRTKKQVAADLPPLTSTVLDCEMEGTQQAIYERYRKVYHQLINDSLEEKGLRESRFTVLEGLTRLRQICCSPSLIEKENGPSSKLNRFLELAEELISEGHRALVFSQFVGFLKLIEAEIKKRGWKYEYLDGQTRDRQKRVDRFQSDSSASLFLISLKAGGEGLNLTAADYVFIMDPWWNPAAERQAMDRTHRIGQTNNVFVYRMATPGTVEEKILRLQERKQGLADKLVVAEAGMFKELNKNDLLSLFE